MIGEAMRDGLWPEFKCGCGAEGDLSTVDLDLTVDPGGTAEETFTVKVPLCSGCRAVLREGSLLGGALMKAVETTIQQRWDGHMRPKVLEVLMQLKLTEIEANIVVPRFRDVRVQWGRPRG